MHWVKHGKCFQTEVPDLHVDLALTHAGVAGSCTMDGFTKEDGEKKVKIPDVGEVTFSMWEQDGELMNLAETTTMHWLKRGECFETQVPDNRVEEALTIAGVAGSCKMDGYTKANGSEDKYIPGVGKIHFSIWDEASAIILMI